MIYFVEIQIDVGDEIILFYFILMWISALSKKKRKKNQKMVCQTLDSTLGNTCLILNEVNLTLLILIITHCLILAKIPIKDL
jgi:hypothetical protein